MVANNIPAIATERMIIISPYFELSIPAFLSSLYFLTAKYIIITADGIISKPNFEGLSIAGNAVNNRKEEACLIFLSVVDLVCMVGNHFCEYIKKPPA